MKRLSALIHVMRSINIRAIKCNSIMPRYRELLRVPLSVYAKLSRATTLPSSDRESFTDCFVVGGISDEAVVPMSDMLINNRHLFTLTDCSASADVNLSYDRFVSFAPHRKGKLSHK